MKTTEKILVSFSLLGIILTLFVVEGHVLLSGISFFLLSLFYLFFGTFLLNNIKLVNVYQKRKSGLRNWKRMLWSVGIGISFSIQVMGLLFLLNNWPSAWLIINAGVFLISIISIISLIKFLSNFSKFHVGVLIRCGALVIATLFCI